MAVDDDVGPPGDAEARPDRRRFLTLAGGAVVVAGAAAVGWELTRGAAPKPPVSAGLRHGEPTTTAASGVRITADDPPALPIPDDLPDPNATTPPVVLGRIAIARLGLDTAMWEGISLAAIDRGPGHWPHTALPGQLGNLVVAGHRTTFTQPFRHLELLQPGDLVRFDVDGVTTSYATRGVVVVPANAVDIAAQSYSHTATLFACHPPGQATQRIVAKLRLVDADGAAVDPDSALPALDDGSQAGGHVLTVRAPDPLSTG